MTYVEFSTNISFVSKCVDKVDKKKRDGNQRSCNIVLQRLLAPTLKMCCFSCKRGFQFPFHAATHLKGQHSCLDFSQVVPYIRTETHNTNCMLTPLHLDIYPSKHTFHTYRALGAAFSRKRSQNFWPQTHSRSKHYTTLASCSTAGYNLWTKRWLMQNLSALSPNATCLDLYCLNYSLIYSVWRATVCLSEHMY